MKLSSTANDHSGDNRWNPIIKRHWMAQRAYCRVSELVDRTGLFTCRLVLCIREGECLLYRGI